MDYSDDSMLAVSGELQGASGSAQSRLEKQAGTLGARAAVRMQCVHSGWQPCLALAYLHGVKA